MIKIYEMPINAEILYDNLFISQLRLVNHHWYYQKYQYKNLFALIYQNYRFEHFSSHFV